ncbi:MAG: aryl-sulfate sulfotransferase, partial [Bacteroidota bacterium]
MLHSTEEAYPGYTLIAPILAPEIYLIDNCGEIVHQWGDSLEPANAQFILPNGDLLRTATGPGLNTTINGGGAGGYLQILDWDGHLRWSYVLANDSVRAHHDLEPLPNGNVLVLAWEEIDEAACLEAGRDPEILPNRKLWPEVIYELRPIFPDGAEIVWEWHLWDHIVQDFDSSKANFGDVSASPGRLDLNFINGWVNNPGEADWVHFNTV